MRLPFLPSPPPTSLPPEIWAKILEHTDARTTFRCAAVNKALRREAERPELLRKHAQALQVSHEGDAAQLKKNIAGLMEPRAQAYRDVSGHVRRCRSDYVYGGFKWSPDSRRLLACYWNGVHVLDGNNGKRIYLAVAPHGNDFFGEDARWLTNEHFVAWFGGDRKAFFDAYAGKRSTHRWGNLMPNGPSYPRRPASTQAEIDHIDSNGFIRISQDGQWTHTVKHTSPFVQFAWRPDGARIAGLTKNGRIVIFDLRRGKKVVTLNGGMTEFRPRKMIWRPDGGALAVEGQGSNGIRIYFFASVAQTWPQKLGAIVAIGLRPITDCLTGCCGAHWTQTYI